MKDSPLILQPVIREYDTRRHEIIDIVSQVQQLLAEGIAPQNISVIYKENKYAEEFIDYFGIINLPVYSRRRLDILEVPIVKKIFRILRYLAAESVLPYSGDHLLFEILHFDLFNIPPIEIARITVEVNEQKHQGLLTSIRKYLYDKINLPPRTLFDIPLHAALANASNTLETLIGESTNVNLQSLLEKLIRDAGVYSYILKDTSKPWLLTVLTSLLDLVKDEILRKPGLSLEDFLDTIAGMQQNRIPLYIPVVTGTEQNVHLLNVEDCKGQEFDYVFLVGCNASAWEKNKDVAGGYNSPDVLSSSLASSNDYEHQRRIFYDALSTARSVVNLSYAKSASIGKLLEPSQFIVEILRQGEVEMKQVCIDSEASAVFEMLRSRKQAPRIENTGEEFIKRIVKNFVMSATALNNYLRCPLEFYFKNIIRSPAGKSEAAEFGSAIHFAIQRLFEKMKADPHEQFPSIPEMIADFTAYMNGHIACFTREGFTRRLEHGKEVLANYYEKYVDTWPRVVAVELNIRNVLWRGVPLKGKVDKLEFSGRDVNVVDYKSGDIEKARIMLNPPSDDMPDGGDYWRQAVFYKILVDHYAGKGWKATGSEIDFVEPGKSGQYEKCKITIRPEDIETVSQQVVRVWERIQQHDFYTGCGRERCHWCGLMGYEV